MWTTTVNDPKTPSNLVQHYEKSQTGMEKPKLPKKEESARICSKFKLFRIGLVWYELFKTL